MQESKKLISAFRVKLNENLIDWRSTAVDLSSPLFSNIVVASRQKVGKRGGNRGNNQKLEN